MKLHSKIKTLVIRVLRWAQAIYLILKGRFVTEQSFTLFAQSLIIWVASFLTGVVAVAYAKVFDYTETLNISLIHTHPEWIFVMSPLGFLLGWWVVHKYAPGAVGSGIPQLTAAVELATAQERHLVAYFLSAKIIVIKILSSVFMILGGAASGREGPTLQIAGSVFKVVHDFIPKGWPKISERIMIMTGGAAGLAAAFNTPLGGIVFVVEDLAKIHIARFRNFVFTGVIIAGLTAQWLFGPYLIFGYPKTESGGVKIFFLAMLTGLFCGVFGAYFTRCILAISKMKHRMMSHSHPWIFVLGIGLLTACFIYFFSTDAMGSGREQINEMLFLEKKQSHLQMLAARYVAPLLSTATGGVTGTFAPALSIGAGIGGVIGDWFSVSEGAYNLLVLCGMTAFLASITRAPFTAAILVLEMTDRHSVIFQLILAAMIGYLVATGLQRKGLYDKQKEGFLEKARKASSKC